MNNVRSTTRIAETVRLYTPDVVCFQEIHKRLPWSGKEDQPDLLGRLLGRRFEFQRTVRFGRGAYGIGIAFRGEISDRIEHMLPSKKEQRGALELRMRNAGGLKRVTVFCTHWGLDPEERVGQADALSEWVAAAAGPVIVCGDLNEGPEGDGVQRLLKNSGLQDADGSLNRPTFVSDAPSVRIDYCLHSSDLTARLVEIGTSQASDHLPLMVEFTMS